MTLHMFRCYIGRGKMSVTDLDTNIDDWVTSNATWEGETVQNRLQTVNIDGVPADTPYYKVDVWFTLDDSKANLLQKFTDKLENKVSWYRVGYHECTHDANEPTECGWQDTTEWTEKDVTVPDYVPTF